MTESEKMKLGLWYDANYDQELSEEREKAEDLYFTFNHTAPKEKALREDILKKLLPKMGERVTILSPFYTDYGYNCNIGSDCFINHTSWCCYRSLMSWSQIYDQFYDKLDEKQLNELNSILMSNSEISEFTAAEVRISTIMNDIVKIQ